MDETINVQVDAVFPKDLQAEVSVTRSKKAFIIECAMRLYSSINFELIDASYDKIAKMAIQRSIIMANELEKAGILTNND